MTAVEHLEKTLNRILSDHPEEHYIRALFKAAKNEEHLEIREAFVDGKKEMLDCFKTGNPDPKSAKEYIKEKYGI